AWNGAAYPGALFFRTGLAADSFTVKTGWDASLRARAGYLVTPSVMIYTTGGPAWLRVTSTSICGTSVISSSGPSLFGPGTIAHSTTKLGATVGGGVEVRAWSRWVARAEYRYSDFGTVSNTDTRACP